MSFLIVAWVSWLSKISKRSYLIWIISILKLFFLGTHKLNFSQQRISVIFTALAKTHWQIFCFDLWSKILVVQFFQKVLLKFSDLDNPTPFHFDPQTRVLPSNYQLTFCSTCFYHWKIFCSDLWSRILAVRRCQKVLWFIPLFDLKILFKYVFNWPHLSLDCKFSVFKNWVSVKKIIYFVDCVVIIQVRIAHINGFKLSGYSRSHSLITN